VNQIWDLPPLWGRIVIACVSGVLLASLWFTWLFAGPLPPTLLLTHYPTVAIAACGLAALISIFLPMRPSEGLPEQLGLYVLALMLFGIPLSGMWSGGPYGYNIIAGLFPYSDAIGYEQGGRSLMENGRLDSWNTRRPLTAILLGSLFTVSSSSLQFTQAILIFVNAVAAFCAARALWASHGLAAGLLMLTTLFAFYSPHLGALLSESLGLALGSTAFALLWYGIHNERRWAIAFGLFALSLGLNARAGAFFVLPAIILWLGWRDAKIDKKVGLKTLVWTSAAAILGFLPGMLVSAAFGSEQGIPFGNFAPSMYGLVVGGKGWAQVYKDFPHISSLPESESFREMYRLAFAAAQENPLQVLKGVGRYYSDYLFDTRWHRFFENRVLRGLAIVFTLIGIAHCIRRRREPALAFLLVTTVGVLLSVPFLYDGAPRAYAATISVTAALIGIGFISVAARWRVPMASAPADSRPPMLAVGVTLVIATLCAPSAWLYAGGAAKKLEFVLPTCPVGATAAVIDTSPGSYVFVITGTADGRSRLPLIHSDILVRDFAEKYSVDLQSFGFVARARDRVTSRSAFVVLEKFSASSNVPPRMNLCGKWLNREIFLGRLADG
jgi:hypothetical protein